MATTNERISSKKKEETIIEDTFKLLKSGEKEILLLNQYRKIVLVVGDSGHGKTMFTEWIAGDNPKLIAELTEGYANEYLVKIQSENKDIDRIINSTLISDTVYPTLILDEKNLPYYDCPGFNDTRSTSNDLATTCFIKQLVDFVDSVKIIFVINYPAVRIGVDRHSFMKVLKQMTEFIKNVEKFKNSIALVVTKVDSSYMREGNILVNDNLVIGTIAKFLEEVRQVLKLKIQNDSCMEIGFYEAAIKLISCLLIRDGETYTKIGIFRRPDQSGPLSEIALLQQGKDNIKRIIYENLTFTEKADADFGFTISINSKYIIGRLVEKINDNVWRSVSHITEEITEHYRTLTNKMRKTINTFPKPDFVADTDQILDEKLSSHLKEGHRIILDFITDIKNVTSPYELAQELKRLIAISEINVSSSDILDIENQGKYFDFFQVLSCEKLNTRLWKEQFGRVRDSMSVSLKILQEDINELVSKTRNYILLNFEQIGKTLRDQLDKKIKMFDVVEVPEKLKNYSDSMQWLVLKSETTTSVKDFLKMLRYVTRFSTIDIPNCNALNIIILEKFLKYLQTFNEKHYCSFLSKWVDPFQNLVNHLNESKSWYNFLNSLYCTFSYYEIQKNKESYNVSNIEDWGNSKATQGILITKMNFQQFLDKLSEYNISELNEIKNITLTEIRKEELNQVLSLTLKQKIKIYIPKPSIFITGDYVRLSDLMKNPEDDLSFSSLLKSGRFESIYIFALKTVFIDEDLTLPGLCLGIIAPKWEIVGDRKINLDGTNGEPHSRLKADDGTDAERNGKDGEPGLPGKPGGIFFGIGEAFVNGTCLTITANGGNGGPGQCGGDGQRGEKGLDAELPTAADSPSHEQIHNGISNIKGFSCKKIGGTSSVYNLMGFDINARYSHAVYEIFGHSGGRGGNGGNGGRGGEGGNPGSITLCELNGTSGVLKHSKRGERGSDGRGGEGGGSGEEGMGILSLCFMFRPSNLEMFFGWSEGATKWVLAPDDHSLIIREELLLNESASGSDGECGINNEKSRNPETARIISEPFKIINKFKSFVIEDLDCNFKRYPLLQFFNKLNENNEIKNIYNTVGLFEEFQEIEQECARYRLKQSYFIPIYQSLLDRISEHMSGMKTLEEARVQISVLKYLYTTILSKICNINDKSKADLIIDIGRFLDMMKRDIENFKEFNLVGNMFSITRKQKVDCYRKLNKKSEESQGLIMEQILPEIKKIGKQIDNNIHLLIDEIIKLQCNAEDKKDCLIMKRIELQDSLAQKHVFNSFKFIATVVTLLSAVGAAVGPITEIATSMSESLALNKAEIPPNMDLNVTSLVQLFENGINDCSNGLLSFLNKLCGILSNKIKIYPEALQDLLPVIEKIQKQKNNTNEKSLGLMEIKALENDLKLKLKRKEEMLKLQQSNKKSKDALKVITRLKKIADSGSLILDFAIDSEIETEKLDELINAVARDDEKYLNLKQYEEKIYNSIATMIMNIEENIFDTATKMDLNSRFALDVTKWRVQSSLKNILFQMRELIQQFTIDENITRCLDLLQEAVIILIKVYDYIEGYYEQQTLTNYIADLNSVFDVSCLEFAEALSQLDIKLKCNLILKHYKTSLDAFKHWVFPFSQNYIKDSKLPDSFKFEIRESTLSDSDQIQKLASDCMEYIDNMKMNVEAYNRAVKGNDKYIYHGEFNSQNFSNMPFFVWKNENCRYLIFRLLSGQEIILKAEVKKSPVNKDAIKFNFIEFLFKCKNESLQSHLDETLKGFDIMATHTGNSYYRCANRIYLITSDKQTIFYSFEKNADGRSVRTNAVYDEIRNGALKLSPYAVWQLKLVNSTNRNSFDELNIFKDDIDIELAGHGSYVTNFNQLSLVDECYRVVEIYDEFDQYLE